MDNNWTVYNSGTLPQDKEHLAELYRKKMTSKFCTVACDNEQTVYQLYNTFVTQRIFDESALKTVSPLLVELTLDLRHKQVFNVNQLNELFKTGCLSDIQNRVVFIAGLSKSWSEDLALLFWENMRKGGALGLVVSSNTNSNNSFVRCLTKTPVTIYTM